jgi:pimeloyl-ACP methyl ester carboxylesterase
LLILATTMLAPGGEKSYGADMAADIGAVASNVKGGVIPEAGHWVMEENPASVTGQVTDFLAR